MARELVSEGCRPTHTCLALSVSRSTFYRHLKPKGKTPEHVYPSPPNKIPGADRQKILDVLHENRFVDLTPREIVPALADEGVYYGSIRTFYRVLLEQGESSERRLQARRIKRDAPILEATAPNQVWTWDITRLRGPLKGQFFFLYVMIDIFSRYVVGWMLAERENARRAQQFIRETVHRHLLNGERVTVHNDRGSPMKAGTTRELIALLGLEHSFSRPRTSDDNPFSEAQFRTIKYHHKFPGFFDSIEHSLKYFEEWFKWYNHDHHHIGLNLLRPADVHFGRAMKVTLNRQAVMDKFFQKYPERFSGGRPIVKMNPQVVGINLHLKSEQVEVKNVEMEVAA